MYDFDRIREHYLHATPEIFHAARKEKDRWSDPYSSGIEWQEMYSPIEFQTWCCIRSFGKAPLYPQYPVGKYFSDFGNPVVKVALECDGREWHLDKDKDLRRDREFEKLGWIVYRVSGADCYRQYEEHEALRESNDFSKEDKYYIIQNWYSDTVEGLIKAIAIFHFDHNWFRHAEEIKLAYNCLKAHTSLNTEFLDEIYHAKRLAFETGDISVKLKL